MPDSFWVGSFPAWLNVVLNLYIIWYIWDTVRSH